MILAATVLGVIAVATSVGLIRAARVPSGLIRTGGYGVDLWAGITAIYAVGLAFAVLPILPATIAAALAAAVAALWIVQRPRRIALVAALGVVGLGAAAAGLSLLSPILAAVVFGVAAIVLASRGLGTLIAGENTANRLPPALRSGPWQRVWLVVVGVAAGAIAAAPAEETGILLLLGGAAAALTFFILTQPSPEHPGTLLMRIVPVAIGLAAVPAALVAADLADTDGVHAALWWGAPAVVVTVAVLVRIVFREVLGPFCEQAPRTPRRFDPEILWVWVGGVLDHSATIVVRPRRGAAADHVSLQLEPGGLQLAPYATPHGVARFEAARLRRDTRYTATVLIDERPMGRCSFRTFGPAPRTIRIAAGSCASTGSNARVFDTIAGLGPDVFCQLGDLHYENIAANDPARFRRAYDDALSSPALSRLMSGVPVAYVYDDHDFGKNNSNAESASKPAAWSVYRERVPHYELGARGDRAYPEPDQGPVYQRFRIGPALVVMTDTRSEREPPVDPDASFSTLRRRRLIGEGQERWLTRAPEEAARLGCQVLVWCTSTPWIGLDGADQDTWTGFPEQRRRIATALLDGERLHGVRTVVVCGDAHMVGLDNGRADRDPATSAPSSDATPTPMGSAEPWQGRLFPAMNAAALDRRGSRKGARYDHYERPGPGQFGLVEIDVDSNGRAAKLRLVVHDVHGRLEYLTVPLELDQGTSSTFPEV